MRRGGERAGATSPNSGQQAVQIRFRAMCEHSSHDRSSIMAEDLQILRLLRAFQKIKDQRRRREIVDLAEASARSEMTERP
jgi:spore coat protein CotH